MVALEPADHLAGARRAATTYGFRFLCRCTRQHVGCRQIRRALEVRLCQGKPARSQVASGPERVKLKLNVLTFSDAIHLFLGRFRQSRLANSIVVSLYIIAKATSRGSRLAALVVGIEARWFGEFGFLCNAGGPQDVEPTVLIETLFYVVSGSIHDEVSRPA